MVKFNNLSCIRTSTVIHMVITLAKSLFSICFILLNHPLINTSSEGSIHEATHTQTQWTSSANKVEQKAKTDASTDANSSTMQIQNLQLVSLNGKVFCNCSTFALVGYHTLTMHCWSQWYSEPAVVTLLYLFVNRLPAYLFILQWTCSQASEEETY